MKTLVVYYSHSGNNRYLARRLACDLGADLEEIRPWMNLLVFQILFSLVKAGAGAARPRRAIGDYDTVVLCGPHWMGHLAYPSRRFLTRHRAAIRRFVYATCCGSSDGEKDGTFGYAGVFSQIKGMAGDACVHCEAFPIILALPEEKAKDNEAIMKTRLSDSNFGAELQSRLARVVRIARVE